MFKNATNSSFSKKPKTRKVAARPVITSVHICSLVTSPAPARRPDSLHDLQSCFLSIRNVPLSRGMWPIPLPSSCVTFDFVYKTQLKRDVLSKRQMMDECISLSDAVYMKFLAPAAHKSFLTCFLVVHRVCFFCRTRTLISFKFNSIWKVLFCNFTLLQPNWKRKPHHSFQHFICKKIIITLAVIAQWEPPSHYPNDEFYSWRESHLLPWNVYRP